jgi:hypothetical protein
MSPISTTSAHWPLLDTDTFQLTDPRDDEPLTSGGEPVMVTIYGPGSEVQARPRWRRPTSS